MRRSFGIPRPRSYKQTSVSSAMLDDHVYAILLAVSVGCGPLIEQVKGAAVRRFLCTVIGIGIIAFACGWDGLHPFVVTLGNCLLITAVGPRKCHIVSFVWCFGYLAFFRAAHYFGFPKPHPVTNALQLFNTLRMIGVAFEVRDSVYLEKRDRETEEETELKKRHQIRPTSFQIITYSLCYVGLFTGPYYKYRTYHDMLHQISGAKIPSWKYSIQRLKHIPAIAITYYCTSYFFDIKYVETEEFFAQPFWFRLFYMVPMFMVFRTRLYAAWIMSEVMSMGIGLGAYPIECKSKCGEGPVDLKALEESRKKDPKALEYEFETVHNLDIWGCELAPTTREGLRSWNMTVQYWLAAYIHRRLPRNYGAMRVAITMMVSAFWHGIHPGYYLSFLTVPPILVAEDFMMAAFRKSSSTQMHLFDWACWFFKMRGFDYMCMGFLLLTLNSTLAYWNSIYFLGHIFVLLFIGIGYICRPRKSKKKAHVE